MHIVSRKSEAKEYIDICIDHYHSKGLEKCIDEVERRLLLKKVKFPLLEYCAHRLYQEIEGHEQIDFCDRLESLKTEGGNVILGIILQDRLKQHFKQSIEKATQYISRADIWYVCDIIGERVYGFSLLKEPLKTIPEIKKLTNHQSNWVIRSAGAGVHYAIKRGLDNEHVRTVFPYLLLKANIKDKEIRQGIGWAAKTTAKFHPDIIETFDSSIQDPDKVANWFRTKVNIGLKRNKYAKGKRS